MTRKKEASEHGGHGKALPDPSLDRAWGVQDLYSGRECGPGHSLGGFGVQSHLGRREGRGLRSIHQLMALGAPQELKEIRWDYTACLVILMPCLSHRVLGSQKIKHIVLRAQGSRMTLQVWHQVGMCSAPHAGSWPKHHIFNIFYCSCFSGGDT